MRRRIAVGGGLALLAAALVAFWVRHSPAADVSTVAPTPTVETRILYMGLRDRTTDAFFLSGGNYHGTWSAWGETPVDPPCTHTVELLAIDSSGATWSIDLAQSIQVPSTGTTAEIDLIGVDPGDYYLEITSACAWQIELTPYD